MKFGMKGTRQYATAQDTSPPLKSATYIRQVVGSLLYYRHAIDNTILPTLYGISTQQSKPAQNTLKNTSALLTMSTPTKTPSSNITLATWYLM